MKTMMRTAAAAGAMAVLLAACGGSPTNATRAGAEGPSYDGGYVIGTGNREAPVDNSTTAKADTTGSDSTGRGGYIIGTGN
jgi:ABC-type glycerol-3-phosphate transport system substrate-binding protein